MKNVILGILLVVSIALGGLLVQQHHENGQVQAKIKALQLQANALQAELAERDARAASLREKLESAQVESVSNAGAAAQLSQALTNQAQAFAEESTNAKPANPFAEMFKNPEMREMIKNQQKTVMGTMVDKNYAEFFKSMNLTPEQTAAMKDLILNKMLSGAEMGMEMMGGEMNVEKRTELTKKMKEANDAINQQIKDLLGAENYSQFEIYEPSIPDRQAVGQLEDQLRDVAPMNANQKDLLTAAISEERQNFKFTTDFSNQQDFSDDMFSRFTEDRINLFLQEQDQLSQKYMARAQTILSAEQYGAYQKSLQNQKEMLKMTMTMAAKMFKR